MPNTSDSPAETRNRSPARASAFSSCSTTLATDTNPLRELLRPALRRDLVAGIRRQDLRDQVRVLGILHGLDGEAGLDRLVVALAHEELTLEPVVLRVLPRFDDFLDVVAPGLGDDLREPLEALVRLAVEHVRVDVVHLVEALHERVVLWRVHGEG